MDGGDSGLYQSAAAYDRHVSRVSDADSRFWQHLAERLGARRLLELGCGSGRVTLPLARWAAPLGGQVVGLDLAPAMLAGAEAGLAAEPAAVRAAVRLAQADMRAFALDERFDLIIIPFNTLGHLHSIKDQLACLATARRHLASGGRFAVDVDRLTIAELYQVVTEPEAGQVIGAEIDPATGRRLVRYRSTRYEQISQTFQRRYTDEWLGEDGARSVEQMDLSLHIFFPRELELLFRLAGYRVEAVYGDYDGGALADDSPQLIMVGVAAEA